jgi:hypothetical protein
MSEEKFMWKWELFFSKVINIAYCHKVAASVFKMVGIVGMYGTLT